MKIDISRAVRFEFSPIILILILILIVSSTLEILSYYDSSEVLKESITLSLVLRAQDNADLISQHINEFKTIIEGVAFRTKVQSMDWNIQKPALIAETKRLNIKRFQVTNLNGSSQSTSGDTPDLSDREWFKKALKGDTYITEPFLEGTDNQIMCVCATPIKNESGYIIGVLAATIDSQFLFNVIRSIKVGKTGYAYIISKEGRIVAHPNPNAVLSKGNVNKLIKEYPSIDLTRTEISGGEKGFVSYSLGGVEKFATYTLIPNTDWILYLSAPIKEVFNDVDVLKYKFLFLILITFALCLFSSFFVIGYILERRRIVGLEKHVEEDERLLRESAELEKIRTQFFANISHEFKTPLNVIISSLQLFKLYYEKGMASQSVNLNKYLRTMNQNCYRLLRLVNNLIDTTRIDVGFLEAHKQNHNIIKIIEDITMSIVEFIEMKGIRLLFDTDAEEKIIACDVDKIERVILNLMSNAIKFTDSGGNIFVNVFDKGESIIITVKDTGIGIPKDKQEKIFERFFQVEQTLTRNHEGSGIGLSMAKSFVEMHGGTLTVVSEFGKGSEFIIELPSIVIKNGEEIKSLTEVQSQQRIDRINLEFSDIYGL